jgi:hypothetical protein
MQGDDAVFLSIPVAAGRLARRDARKIVEQVGGKEGGWSAADEALGIEGIITEAWLLVV